MLKPPTLERKHGETFDCSEVFWIQKSAFGVKADGFLESTNPFCFISSETLPKTL